MNTIELPKELEDRYIFEEDLSKYSYFRTGGKVRAMFFPRTLPELAFFLKRVNKDIQLFVIGAGSNLLIRDSGFDGVVINIKYFDETYIREKRIFCGCGVLNSKLFNFAKKNSIGGYEFLGLIPGTVGGSCKMNAGCYGQCMADILEYIDTIDFNGNVKRYYRDDFELGYRYNSISDNVIFTNVCLKVNKIEARRVVEQIFEEKLLKKKETQPINAKTCGSTFKNLPDMPAWKIIQELGFQGVNFNGVKMSEKHANFLVNKNGTSTDIENLIKNIQEKAKLEKNIDLELELKILG